MTKRKTKLSLKEKIKNFNENLKKNSEDFPEDSWQLNIQSSLSAIILSYLRKSNESQKEFSEKSGITKSDLSNIINMKSNPGIRTISKILVAVNFDKEYLMIDNPIAHKFIKTKQKIANSNVISLHEFIADSNKLVVKDSQELIEL